VSIRTSDLEIWPIGTVDSASAADEATSKQLKRSGRHAEGAYTITLTTMSLLDDTFLALPLGSLSDAALSKAKELGCSHAEIRVERIRQAYRSFRDHALETTADGQVLGLSVRVVQSRPS